MRMAREWRMGRRDFLLTTTIGSLALSFGVAPAAAEDRPTNHNMLVFGEHAVFFSHLPMFHGLNADGTGFSSPHRYQVILEAALTTEQSDSYVKDRRAHPDTRFYTLGPEAFVLSQLFTPEGAPRRTSFTATVFRGHLEADGKQVPGLKDVLVKIARVVHGRMFDPHGKKPAGLEYLLFGRGTERFLAHSIFTPPDFDHVLPVNLTGAELTDRDLEQDARIVVPNRSNVAAERLRQGQHVEAMLHIGATSPRKVQIDVGPQIYFEEGELLVPPNFDPTDEEKKQ
jgi:hypothetical protein